MFDLTIEDSIEAREYLRGVLFADKAYRLDTDVDVDVIDPYGTGNQAFWRGFLEGCGSFGMPNTRGLGSPRIEIKAVPAILHKFIAFIEEANAERCGMKWIWDAEGKLAWMANGGFIRVTGTKALEVTLALYMGAYVGRESCRALARRIFEWAPSK